MRVDVAQASVTIVNPKMEQYRDVVEAAGIEDWPIAYRGHILYVEAEYSVSTAVPPEPCDGCDAGPPSLNAKLVYDEDQFLIINETLEVNTTSSSSGNWTIYTAVAVYMAELLVRQDADVFGREDWSGNYTREEIYMEWVIEKPIYSCEDENCTNYTVDVTSDTEEDHPDPRHLRLYARQPSYGLILYSLVYSSETECYWSNATLGVRLENPGTGVPGPWSGEWQKLARLRPGQLIVEGLSISLDVRGLQSNKSMASASWVGDLYSPLRPGEYLELNLSVADTGLDRSVVIYPEAYAVWDKPQGPTVKPVSVGPSRASLPWGWVWIWDAPASIVYASNSTMGPVYSVQGPWPARLCLPLGSWELECSNCYRVWVHVDEPINVTMIERPAPQGTSPGAPVGFRDLILVAIIVLSLLYIAAWVLARS
ncbi:MAG: hypothetical protein GSR84_03045 [Desulfurococcales archaeon]|nr:hypothetical protein [Desulfurococcales archaeon]